MRKRRSVIAIGMILLLIAASVFLLNDKEGIAGEKKAEIEVREKLSRKVKALNVPFVRNEGQINSEVNYYAKTFGGTLFVTKKGQLVYTLPKREGKVNGKVKKEEKETKVQSAVIIEEFLGAEVEDIKGEIESERKMSYFVGNDPNKHRSELRTYDTVSLGEIYRGIELRLKAYGNNVEKLFYVRPGAKPEEIKVGIRGSKGIRVNEEGELVVETVLGEVKFTRPVAYQEKGGKRVDVVVEYGIIETGSLSPLPYDDQGSGVRPYVFRVREYDRTRELVIDPLLQSTYLGGSGDGFGRGIATHPITGDVYVTGWTLSNDFPQIIGGADTTFSFVGEAFVSRLNSSLTTLYQSTYLGGSSEDWGWGITIHPTTGDVYVVGWTESNDFPGIAGGADTTVARSEVFVSRLNSTLTTLHQSTYLGGSGYDYPGLNYGSNAIAIHPTTGDVYVTGWTQSNDFPGIAGGADTTFEGSSEAFVSRLNSTLTTLYQSSYLGGSGNYDTGCGIAIHPATGDVYVTGWTQSNDFPGIAGGADTTFEGSSEAFVSRLNSDLTTLYQSTYLGGSSDDVGNGIAIHSTTGDVYVTGGTGSNDFPQIAGGADTTFAGATEAFVSRFNTTLTTLYQSTYLGGSGYSYEIGCGIAIHPTTGDAYVDGTTSSQDFPGIAGGADITFAGATEVFVSRLNSGLNILHQSTYLGGSGIYDIGYGITIHPITGDVYVTGWTQSNDFPGIAGGADTTFAGFGEAFVSRLTSSLMAVDPPTLAKAFGASSIPLNGSTSLTFTINNPNTNVTLTGIAFTDNLPAGLVVANPSGLSSTCGGTAIAVSGSGSVSLTGATIATSSSCTLTVNVTGTASGVKNNTTEAVTSTNGGTGNTASASVNVENVKVVTVPTLTGWGVILLTVFVGFNAVYHLRGQRRAIK